MKIEKIIKPSFSVIGKEGSTLDGQGFIRNLWDDVNSHFYEVESLIKRDENGNFSGIWGAMSDCSRSFKPWEENFSKVLYLAGFECIDTIHVPEGWIKWTIPGYEYLCVEFENNRTFLDVLEYMHSNNLSLIGAVHDYTCPISGINYMYFPINTIQ